MNQAVRLTSAALGISAGIAGLGHGIFEILQGSARPAGLIITSIGPPCQPEASWNTCGLALTILPNFLLTGLLATVLGLLMIGWAVVGVPRRYGGLVFMALSVGLLLFGGGLFSPLVGLVAGLLAGRITRPLTWARAHFRGSLSAWLARFYPEALVAFLVTFYGQFIIGHYFNDLLQRYLAANILFILGFLLLAVVSAVVADAYEGDRPAGARPLGG